MTRAPYVVVSFVVVCLAVLWLDNQRTKPCGSTDIAGDGSCTREGQVLNDVSRRCQHVLDHDSIRDTPWVRNIRARWDGSIHQLVDTGHAPAVTTEKTDIRLCLDTHSSRDAQVFVCLHELSHIAVDSYGHTPEFWRCFKALINAATAMGVYTHTPDAKVCGTRIGPQPDA
jgi:hypothetical protein